MIFLGWSESWAIRRASWNLVYSLSGQGAETEKPMEFVFGSFIRVK